MIGSNLWIHIIRVGRILRWDYRSRAPRRTESSMRSTTWQAVIGDWLPVVVPANHVPNLPFVRIPKLKHYLNPNHSLPPPLCSDAGHGSLIIALKFFSMDFETDGDLNGEVVVGCSIIDVGACVENSIEDAFHHGPDVRTDHDHSGRDLNEHDKIRELSQQLAAEKKRSATYKRHLEMLFEHIEEHDRYLSNKIQDIVVNVRELESKDQQNCSR
ncbi:hypothetical protein DM860_005745 [Cuscuta australis]|uniref:Uncharacterized protein n=1 Tax=Cuscuta australis TaxID=267555 RepID=A0A328DVW2_9ASTE|nr:hypothetical protein DM860_005745 [Cuscuta australis]